MALMIRASNIDKFTKVKYCVDKFDKDFIKIFELAEFVMEGVCNDIQLSTGNFYNEKIELPKGFAIEEIKNHVTSSYCKDTEGFIKEEPRYQIDIEGIFEDERYKLVYYNLSKPNINIVIKRI